MYSQEKVAYGKTDVGQHVHFHDRTYSYKQSYTHESFQNEISTNKSIDFAHCETFSQCQPGKCCLTYAVMQEII